MELTDKVRMAVECLRQADGLLITAGAGMGVDSGLPDFRGSEGFWNAYPALKQANLRFGEIANPSVFESAPELAWGFYGHRLQLYRNAVPHAGFCILKDMAAKKPHGAFVFTSNIDGQFQKAGFDESRIVECHGSIHHQQCCRPCTENILSTKIVVKVDAELCRLTSATPRCPFCGDIARPNVMMFNDYSWLPGRSDRQRGRMEAWLRQVKKLVVIELGAGIAIPTVRNQGERMQVPLIRINPTHFTVRHQRDVSLAVGALTGLQLLQEGLDAAGAINTLQP